jgi:hypothetical protein
MKIKKVKLADNREREREREREILGKWRETKDEREREREREEWKALHGFRRMILSFSAARAFMHPTNFSISGDGGAKMSNLVTSYPNHA